MAAVIYDQRYSDTFANDWNFIYLMSGWIRGCSPIDSLLLSTLECLYIHSDCFPLLMGSVAKVTSATAQDLSQINIRPLVYDPALSHFPPNTSISTIIEQLIIEQWNSSFSHSRFYTACAPSYCTYSRNIRTKTIVGVILTLVSTIGGLTISLRVITPHLVTILFKLLTSRGKRQQQQRGDC
jgi:hypothetical protein